LTVATPTPEWQRAFRTVTGKECTPANLFQFLFDRDVPVKHAIQEEHARILREGT
jgi:hypothetical protein